MRQFSEGSSEQCPHLKLKQKRHLSKIPQCYCRYPEPQRSSSKARKWNSCCQNLTEPQPSSLVQGLKVHTQHLQLLERMKALDTILSSSKEYKRSKGHWTGTCTLSHEVWLVSSHWQQRSQFGWIPRGRHMTHPSLGSAFWDAGCVAYSHERLFLHGSNHRVCSPLSCKQPRWTIALLAAMVGVFGLLRPEELADHGAIAYLWSKCWQVVSQFYCKTHWNLDI